MKSKRVKRLAKKTSNNLNQHNKRIEKIVATCEKLNKQNWQDLYLQTIELRKHNYNTFFNEEKLSEQINKTLSLFFEFADSR